MNFNLEFKGLSNVELESVFDVLIRELPTQQEIFERTKSIEDVEQRIETKIKDYMSAKIRMARGAALLGI